MSETVVEWDLPMITLHWLVRMHLAHMVASNSSLTTHYPIFHVYEWRWGNNLHAILTVVIEAQADVGRGALSICK